MGYPIEDSDDLGTEEAAPTVCERCAKRGGVLVEHPEEFGMWFHPLCLELDIIEWRTREEEAARQGRKEMEAS